MKGQKVDEETDSARPFEGKGEFYLLQIKTPSVHCGDSQGSNIVSLGLGIYKVNVYLLRPKCYITFYCWTYHCDNVIYVVGSIVAKEHLYVGYHMYCICI